MFPDSLFPSFPDKRKHLVNPHLFSDIIIIKKLKIRTKFPVSPHPVFQKTVIKFPVPLCYDIGKKDSHSHQGKPLPFSTRSISLSDKVTESLPIVRTYMIHPLILPNHYFSINFITAVLAYVKGSLCTKKATLLEGA